MTMAPSSVFLPTLPGRYYTEPASEWCQPT